MATLVIRAEPHEEAARLIRGKPAVLADVFKRMLPEIRARAFTVAGVEAANVLQGLRDRIAELPRGADWNDVKRDVLADISPWLVTANDPEERDAQARGAVRRAELLVRQHGFQAYQASKYQVMERQKAVFPFWQYVTMGDGAVRDSHAALNGLILPANDPFWADHYPPWDFGCRCQVVPIMAEERDEAVAAGRVAGKQGAQEAGDRAKGWVLGPAADRDLHAAGRLDWGGAHAADVRSPSAKADKLEDARAAYRWHPGDLQLPLDQLSARYDRSVWAAFERHMRAAEIEGADGRRIGVWDWLLEPARRGIGQELAEFGARMGKERVAALDVSTGARLGSADGKERSVDPRALINAARREKRRIELLHNHPGGGMISAADVRTLIAHRDVAEEVSVHGDGVRQRLRMGVQPVSDSRAEVLCQALDDMRAARKALKASIADWQRLLRWLQAKGYVRYEQYPE